MSVVDWVIILVALFGLYIGWCAGAFKSLVDSIALFVSSVLAGLLSKLIVSHTYTILPFFNFFGKVQGLKSINIIFYRIVVYIVLLLIILVVIKKISKKIKLSDKLVDSMVEVNFVSRILGVVCFVPAIVTFLFSALLVLHLPNLSFSPIHEAKISKFILTKTPVLSSQNKDVYDACVYAVRQINTPDNTKENYAIVNQRIVDYLANSEMISSDDMAKLASDDKLLGRRETDKYDYYYDYDDPYDPESGGSGESSGDGGNTPDSSDSGDQGSEYDDSDDGDDSGYEGDYEYYDADDEGYNPDDDIIIDEDSEFFLDEIDEGVSVDSEEVL